MTAGLRELAVPIVSIASAVAFIMGLKLLCRVRSAPRGTLLLASAFVLALAGVGIEAVGVEPKQVLAGLAAGVLLGVSLGYATRVDLGAGPGPLLSSAGGVAALLLGLATFRQDET